jgi:threonine aldolase
MAAYLKDGLWLSLARDANTSATRLAQALTMAGAELAHPVDGNEVFAILPPGLDARLKAAGVTFYPWIDGSHRFVCSWATEQSEIDAFSALLA